MIELSYIDRVLADARDRFPPCPAYTQILDAAASGLEPLVAERPEYAPLAALERLTQPVSACVFTFLWESDSGRVRLNRGYCISYGAVAAAPRGALFFREGLTAPDAAAMTFRRMLTAGLAGGTAAGLCGADCDPRRLSDRESMRFCRSFLAALRRSGQPLPIVDGTAWERSREAGYLAAQAAALGAERKPQSRPLPFAQATGFGLCYFAKAALRRLRGVGLSGKAIAISGCGAAAMRAAEKALQLGAQVCAVSDDGGCLYAPAGMELSLIRALAEAPVSLRRCGEASDSMEYRPGSDSVFDLPADVFLLCRAVPPGDDALDALLAAHPLGVFEGVEAALRPDQARALGRSGILYASGVAAAAGQQTLEASGAAHSVWDADHALRVAMDGILSAILAENRESLAAGAYAAAFRRLGDALLSGGLI